MNVIRSAGPIGPVTKGSTVVGKVYTNMHFGDEAYFRVQGGFAILNTGQFVNYTDAKESGWVLEPNAIIDLDPGDA